MTRRALATASALLALAACANEVRKKPSVVRLPGRVVTGFAVCGFTPSGSSQRTARFDSESLGDGDVRVSFYDAQTGTLLTRLTVPQDVSVSADILEEG